MMANDFKQSSDSVTAMHARVYFLMPKSASQPVYAIHLQILDL